MLPAAVSPTSMTIEQLRIFLAVAQHLHFTRAAEALYLTQPSVSAAIQNLEGEFGMQLFHRIGRRVELTQAGRLLQGKAQQILDQIGLTKRALQELKDLHQGELILGASQTIGNYWLPRFISQFKHQYPGIRVHCKLGNTQEVSAGTAAGTFDLGLEEGAVPTEMTDYLEQQVIGGDQLQIVVGQSHPWYERTTVSLTELATTAWVMREAGSGTRQIFEQTLMERGIEPNVILELSSGEMVKAVIEDGIGAAALSELIVSKELQFGVLRAIAVTDPANPTGLLTISRSFTLLKHRERFQTRIAQTFEQLLVSAPTCAAVSR